MKTCADKKTQRAQILRLLVEAKGEEVSLQRILDLRISQFGSRIYELRRLGFRIINRTVRAEGQVRSWFRLENQKPSKPTPPPQPKTPQQPEPGLLFELPARLNYPD
jgi:Helix-turn-helix domain